MTVPNIPGSAITDDVFVDYLIWMVTHDESFLSLYSDVVLPETFSTKEIAWLVETAKKFYSEHEAVLPREALIMLLNELPEDRNLDHESILKFFDDAPEPSKVVYGFLHSHAKGWFQRRAMYAALDQAGDMLADGRVADARDLMALAATELSSVGDDDYGVACIADAETFLEALEKNFSEDGGNAIKTGMPTVDKIMRGGLRPGELGVWMAPPAGGKSQALVWTARQALMQGYNVIYYTLEMDWQLIHQRLWAGVIDMSTDEMDADIVEAQRLVRLLPDRAKQEGWGEIIVKQYPAKAASVATLASHISMLATRHNFRPDLLIVDYADILKANRHYDVRRDELATVYEDLRGLGQLLGLPIWTASQANREGFVKGKLRMDHIADSWDKAKISDYIFALCQNEVQKENREMVMNPIKVRNNAAPDEIEFTVDYSRAMFYDHGV